MSARTTSEVAQKATRAIVKAKKPSPTALGPRRKRGPNHEHGREIFVFHHLQKNMMVYSLTKALRNNAALNQIPYNGKKTVPAALRKDLWHPFAQIKFPEGKGFVGLSAFQKLREYRKRHELEWEREEFMEIDREATNKRKDGRVIYKNDTDWEAINKPGQEGTVAYKKFLRARGRKICDQKANSVADMAAVLGRLALKDKPKPEIVNGRKIWPPSIGLKREGQGVPVQVLWRDLTDAEFAETWAENVEHGVLPMHTNHRDPKRVWGFGRMLGREGEEFQQEESIPEVVTVTKAEPEKVVL